MSTMPITRPEECPACLSETLFIYPGQHATVCPMFHGHQVRSLSYFGLGIKCACGHESPDGTERERHLALMAKWQHERALAKVRP